MSPIITEREINLYGTLIFIKDANPFAAQEIEQDVEKVLSKQFKTSLLKGIVKNAWKNTYDGFLLMSNPRQKEAWYKDIPDFRENRMAALEEGLKKYFSDQANTDKVVNSFTGQKRVIVRTLMTPFLPTS